jgi:hypothetical protein
MPALQLHRLASRAKRAREAAKQLLVEMSALAPDVIDKPLQLCKE